MKRFDELSPDEQARAIERCTNKLLEAIVEGGIRFNDALNGDDLQARIDAAMAEMDRTRTPWFNGQAVMETCSDEIEGMARCDAEDALYAEPNEHVIHGIVKED